MNSKRFCIVVLIGLSLAVGSPRAQTFLHDSIYIFSSPLSPENILLHPDTCHYVPYRGHKINFGLHTPNHWCYIIIKVESEGRSDYLLSIDNTSIDTVMLFELNPNGTKHLGYVGGNLIPYSDNRQFVWHTLPLSHVDGTTFYLAAFQDRGKNINVGYKITPREQLEKLYVQFDRIIWFYLGIAFLIFVVTVLGYFFLRSKAIGFYALYILCVTAWVLSHYGYLYPAFYPRVPVLNNIVKPMSILLALLFLTRVLQLIFASDFLKDKTSRIILKVLSRFGLLVLASMLLYPSIPHAYWMPSVFNLTWHSYFSFSFLCLILVLVRLFNKDITARLFALALGLVVLMSIQQTLSNSGYFYIPFLNNHGIVIASIAEMLLLTYAIFSNTGKERKRTALRLAQLRSEHAAALEQLVNVQDNERKRIAGELHDSIGPMLAAIKINFMRVAKSGIKRKDTDLLVTKTEEIIDGSIAEIREMSHQLMPKALLSDGLVVSLSNYFCDLREVYHIPIEFSHNITDSLQNDVQLNLYRIMCELVLNAVKHSGASVIRAELRIGDGSIALCVQDNGGGFNPARVKESSFGLRNIQSRAEYLKGAMHVETGEGKGTRIQITVEKNGR